MMKKSQVHLIDKLFPHFAQYYQVPELRQVEKIQYQLNFDGSCRNNPGQCGVGIYINTNPPTELSMILGHGTNNYAEYMALIFGMRVAIDLGIERLICQGDSKLVIDSMLKKIKLHKPELQELNKISKKYCKFFTEITFQLIPREQNTLADKLSNLAHDK